MESAGDAACAAGFSDWSRLPQDLLVIVFLELEIPDLLRSGAVCTTWHCAYSTFRRLRLPSLKQTPCLLYSCDTYGPDAAALYCPATGSTFRISAPDAHLRNLWFIGSADGWMVAANEIGDLHLLNPLTGRRVELPPVTAMHHVEASLDEEGGLVYDVDEDLFNDPGPTRVPALEVRDCMYFRAVLSCGPSAGAMCVVLLLHMPNGQLSYARPGDERWTWVSPDDNTGLQCSDCYRDAAYNKEQGLFYVVQTDDSVQTLDLNGPSPVAKMVFRGRKIHNEDADRYLIHSPWGDLVHAWRYRTDVASESSEEADDVLLHSSVLLQSGEESDEEDDDDYDDIRHNDFRDSAVELNTTEIQLYKTDLHGQKLESLPSLGDHALFLGYNSSLCLPVKDIPGLKPNHAYITDDSFEFISYFKQNKREVGVWSIECKTLESIHDPTHVEDSWLNWPPPIWIVPSLL
uniref:Uncharacterized protein n=1 Tax=Avena sativa TaxID=4498 RepID=A0ACD5W6J1_AVESA